MIRCKALCTSKQHYNNGEFTDLHLYIVDSENQENKQVFAGSSIGRCVLLGVNKATADHFEQGKEYYINLTPVE